MKTVVITTESGKNISVKMGEKTSIELLREAREILAPVRKLMKPTR